MFVIYKINILIIWSGKCWLRMLTGSEIKVVGHFYGKFWCRPIFTNQSVIFFRGVKIYFLIVHVIWTSDIFVFFLFWNLVLDKINFNSSFEVEIVMQTYIFFSKARLLNRWIEKLCQNEFWLEVHLFKYLPLNKGKVYYTGNILHMYKINNR